MESMARPENAGGLNAETRVTASPVRAALRGRPFPPRNHSTQRGAATEGRPYRTPLFTGALVILPLRYSSRSPRRACCLHRLFKPRQVAFDERSQLVKDLFEFPGSVSVVILLRLC